MTAEATATERAQATADQAAADAYVIETTRTAIEVERRIDQYNRAERRADFVNAFVGAVLISGTLLAMFLLWLRFRPQPKLRETNVGTFLLVPVAGPGITGMFRPEVQARPLLPAGDIIDGETSPLGYINYTVNGQERPPLTTAKDSNPEKSNRALVRRLLREARIFLDAPPASWVRRYGDRRDVLPGNRHLSLNADEWSRAVQVLKDPRNGVVETTQGGTFFQGSWDIDTALMPTNRNRLNYSPAPPA
jgi:hypothetical protein